MMLTPFPITARNSSVMKGTGSASHQWGKLVLRSAPSAKRNQTAALPWRRLQCGSEERVPTTKRSCESFGAAIRNFTRRICPRMSPPPHGGGSSRRNPRFRAGSPSKRPAAGILPFAAARGNPRSGAHMLSGGPVRPSRRADIADFGAWRAPRGEGRILPIEPCDGKSDRQRRSPSLYRSILWSGDRTCETPKS